MPTRMIREGLLDSEPMARAGELAEILFTRLMLVADDYGRFDGRVSVICRRCWPIGGPTEREVLERLTALTENGLVVAYEVNGKPFIYIPKFNQRLRTKNPSKYPDPPDADAAPSNVSHRPDIPPTNDSAVRREARSEKREVEARSEKREAQRASGQPPPEPRPPDTATSAGTAAAAVFENLKTQPQPPSLQEARIDSSALTPAGVLAAICVANGIKATAFNPLVIEWAMRGYTSDRLKGAIATARQRKPMPQSIPLAYLDPILASDETKPADTGWRRDPNAAAAKGREVGIHARPGEEMPDFVRRIDEALHERARAQVQ